MNHSCGAKSFEVFSIDGASNIMEGANLGIFNGKLTVNTPCQDVLSFNKLIAPPFVSSDFVLDIRLFGEKVKASQYTWNPFKIERQGGINGVGVRSELILVDGARTALMLVDVENRGEDKKVVPLQANIKGGLDRIDFYEFVCPKGVKECKAVAKGNKLVRRNDAGAIIAGSDLAGLAWKDYSSMWETTLALKPGESRRFFLAFGIGSMPEADASVDKVMRSPLKEIERTNKAWEAKTDTLFDSLPVLESDNQRLVSFYNRSLLPFLFNRWDVPKFVLRPYYSTGGVNGGCIGLYLWNIGDCCEILPLFDPPAAKEHIKHLLSIDLTAHFAFSPGSGEAFGPWYPINQEKIISLIYFYVLHTGDVEFLNEEVNGRSVLDWAMHHAAYRDDFSKPAVLVDYGIGNNHLELRRQFRYDNFMPDLNGKRYESYKRVAALFEIRGRKPPIDLVKRAKDLKTLFLKKMWDEKEKWFVWLGEAQKSRNIRYTAEIFELFGTGVLERNEEKGLLSHINEKEFLSEFGLHSMSKKDPAYHQEDIDNGGGGICTCILPVIIEKLYKSGCHKEANDILGRILWWGDRLPYWTDSHVANFMDYRHDSPLMNDVGALAGARSIIFGLFGVEVNPNSDIVVNPKPTTLSQELSLRGLKVRGEEIDVTIKKNSYEVKHGNSRSPRKMGTQTLICGRQSLTH